MSVLLRQAAQIILDQHGLQEFHVEVDQYNKTLEIVEECGREFIKIKGIQLSRSSPSNKEIDATCELLDVFFAKYAADIAAILAQIKVLHTTFNTPEPPAFISYTPSRYLLQYWDNSFNVLLNKSGNIIQLNMQNETVLPFPDKGLLKLDPALYAEMCVYHKYLIAKDAQLKIIQDLKNPLQTCHI